MTENNEKRASSFGGIIFRSCVVVETAARIFCVCNICMQIVGLYVLSEDWLADGYRFRQNGFSLLPRSKPSVKKVHYRIYLPGHTFGSFRKCVYESLNPHDGDFKVVHYIGKEEEAVDFPHGKYIQPEKPRIVTIFEKYLI
jgi:hypothetical protein